MLITNYVINNNEWRLKRICYTKKVSNYFSTKRDAAIVLETNSFEKNEKLFVGK